MDAVPSPILTLLFSWRLGISSIVRGHVFTERGNRHTFSYIIDDSENGSICFSIISECILVFDFMFFLVKTCHHICAIHLCRFHREVVMFLDWKVVNHARERYFRNCRESSWRSGEKWANKSGKLFARNFVWSVYELQIIEHKTNDHQCFLTISECLPLDFSYRCNNIFLTSKAPTVRYLLRSYPRSGGCYWFFRHPTTAAG